MNREHSDNPKPSEHTAQAPQPLIGAHVKPADVPVFNCIVYVSANAGGGVRARVANLAGLEFTAGSEREVLGKVVTAFKQRVGELHRSGMAIPWIEPPSPAETGEQQRLIPVHL